MKELKYRAWDKSFKVMRKVTMVNFYNSDIAVEVQSDTIYMSGERPTSQRLLGGGQYELMQFTGLKDKNGVEIYEGDILIDRHEEEIGQVVFEDAAFFWETKTFAEYLWDQHAEIEIIGNIFDNPELVK